MSKHNVLHLHSQLEKLTKQVGLVANFRSHNDVLKEVFYSALNGSNRDNEALSDSTTIEAFFKNLAGKIDKNWKNISEKTEQSDLSIETMSASKSFHVSFEGLEEYSHKEWAALFYDIKIRVKFLDCELLANATLTSSVIENKMETQGVTYIALNGESILDIMKRESGSDNVSITHGAAGEVSRRLEDLIDNYLLAVGNMDVSSDVYIPLSLGTLNDIEMNFDSEATPSHKLGAFDIRDLNL